MSFVNDSRFYHPFSSSRIAQSCGSVYLTIPAASEDLELGLTKQNIAWNNVFYSIRTSVIITLSSALYFLIKIFFRFLTFLRRLTATQTKLFVK